VSKVKGGDVEPGFYGSGVYYGTSGNVWGEQRKMERNYLTEGKDTLDDKVPLADPRRREELEAFLASGVNVAVSHQDFAHTPPSSPHHFLLIVKDDRGAWRNMDHTSNSYQRRGGLTDWGRVYRVDADAAMQQAAAAQIKAARDAPAPEPPPAEPTPVRASPGP
jgi:hypothetical protein